MIGQLGPSVFGIFPQLALKPVTERPPKPASDALGYKKVAFSTLTEVLSITELDILFPEFKVPTLVPLSKLPNSQLCLCKCLCKEDKRRL